MSNGGPAKAGLTPRFRSLAVCGGFAFALTLVAGASAPAAAPTAANAVIEYPLPQSGSLPYHIAKGPDGNLWFTEQTGHRIGRISTAGTITEFALPGGGNPIGIAAGPDGNLWFTEAPPGRIGRIDTSGPIAEFSTGLSAGSSPGDITAGPDGALWFTEDGGKIGRISTAGAISEFALPGGSFTLDGITADADGIWFTEGFPTEVVGRMNVRTQHVTVFPLGPNGGIPDGITAGPDGNMWFTRSSSIDRNTSGGTNTEFALGADRTGAKDMVRGPDDSLWFSDFNDSLIGRITTAGAIREFPVSSGSSPAGIAVGPDGNLWFPNTTAARLGNSCSLLPRLGW